MIIHMKSSSGGYIGILLLFLGTALVIFLAFQQYERIGQRQNRAVEQEGVEMQNSEGNKILYPIDRALDAKEALEARDRMLMEQ